MSALAEAAPATMTRYACTECAHPPFENQRAISIHLVRTHKLTGEQRSGKAVMVEVPIDGEFSKARTKYRPLQPVGDHHVSALRLPTSQVIKLDAIITKRGVGNRAELIREAVQFYLAASDSETWKEKFTVERRRRIAAEEKVRRIQTALLAEANRIDAIARG